MNLPTATTKIKLKRTEICIFASPLKMSCREKGRSYFIYENRLLYRLFRFFLGDVSWKSGYALLKTWINCWRHQMSSAKYVGSQWWGTDRNSLGNRYQNSEPVFLPCLMSLKLFHVAISKVRIPLPLISTLEIFKFIQEAQLCTHSDWFSLMIYWRTDI